MVKLATLYTSAVVSVVVGIIRGFSGRLHQSKNSSALIRCCVVTVLIRTWSPSAGGTTAGHSTPTGPIQETSSQFLRDHARTAYTTAKLVVWRRVHRRVAVRFVKSRQKVLDISDTAS